MKPVSQMFKVCPHDACTLIYHWVPRKQETTGRQLNEENLNVNIVKSGVRGVAQVCRWRFPGSSPPDHGEEKVTSCQTFIRLLISSEVWELTEQLKSKKRVASTGPDK